MKISIILLGLAIIGLSIAFIQDDFINLKIKNSGHIVRAEIIEKPRFCLGTKAKYFMKVKCQNKLLTKQIPAIFCEEHALGDFIDVRYLEGEDRILLPEEGVSLEFISSGVLILFGLYIIYLGMINNRKMLRNKQ